MTREPSACVMLKFSGYSFLRQTFRFEEKKDLVPINIVREPTLNDQKPIECFLHKKSKKLITQVLKLKEEVKNHYHIEMQNNVAILKFFLLKPRKKWKNM